ncbi:MAG: multidrug efflux system membrane fusion protein [Cocleimonas sp.]|jgi:multidrug efflux system membrane fusion protein
MSLRSIIRQFLTIGIMGLLLGGLVWVLYFKDLQSANNQPAAATTPPPAMPVNVQQIKNEPIQLWKNYSARTQAIEIVEVRPQVTGIITKVLFKDGDMVKANQTLFRIDSKSFKSNSSAARSELAAAKNRLSLADKELKRNQKLIKSNTIARRIYDQSVNEFNVAKANVNGARARLNNAGIDLSYTDIKAPISGRVGRINLKKGNLVNAASAPVMTTIVSTRGIYADFEVDEYTYIKQIRNIAKDRQAESLIPIRLNLENGKIYEGNIDSFDNRIDISSGTIKARAYFENEDNYLIPGMFVNIELGNKQQTSGIVLPEKAIGTDQDRKFVFIVNAENNVEYRQIKLGETTLGKRIIDSGLKDGDKVIIDGVIRIRPGMSVDPKILDPLAEKPEAAESNKPS